MCIILDFIETKLFTLQRRFGDQRSRKKIRTNHLPSLQSGLRLPICGLFRHRYPRWRFYSQRSRKRFSWRSHFTQMFRLKIQLFPRFNWVVQRFFAWSQKAGDGSKIQSGHDIVKVLIYQRVDGVERDFGRQRSVFLPSQPDWRSADSNGFQKTFIFT